MSKLRDGWAATTLGKVIALNYGKSLPASNRDGGQFAVYGSNGIVGNHSEAITEFPTIVVGRKGSFGEVHFSDQKCYPIDTTYYVDSFDLLIPRFAFHLLRHLPLTDMNRSSAIPGLNREDAYALDIELPPLPEQQRIVVKMDGLTTRATRARKELDRALTLIARYKQRLLALAFSGELTADWRSSRSLPETTEVALADVAKGFSYGSSAKSAPSGDVPVLRMGNIQDGRLDWANLVFTSEKAEIEKYTLMPGDVLFNRTNSPELVGKTALYKGEREAVYAGYLIRIQCTEKLLPEFLTYCLNSPLGREYCWAVKTDGVSQSNINAKKIAAFHFLLPTVEEQAEIVRRIESAFCWLDRMAAEHAAAARFLPKLDAAILAKAFRGELVPQDPKDEPASVLLERVKTEQATQGTTSKSGRGRKPNGSKALLMTEKALPPRDRLLKDSEKWPVVGLPFEAIAMRNSMPHDTLRDALFELLSGPKPALQQRFDNDAEVMVIQRVPA